MSNLIVPSAPVNLSVKLGTLRFFKAALLVAVNEARRGPAANLCRLERRYHEVAAEIREAEAAIVARDEALAMSPPPGTADGWDSWTDDVRFAPTDPGCSFDPDAEVWEAGPDDDDAPADTFEAPSALDMIEEREAEREAFMAAFDDVPDHEWDRMAAERFEVLRP